MRDGEGEANLTLEIHEVGLTCTWSLPEEAKLELQTAKKNFLMFKNSDTGENNVIYKRDDGNYGLVEPKF